MATPMFFKKDGNRLAPCDEKAEAVLSRIKNGAELRIEITRPRNIRHHRKFYALVNLVFQNQESYKTVDHLVAALKAAVNHCDVIQGADDSTLILAPKSISFGSMDQTAFDEFYDRCIDVIAKSFLSGVDEDDLRREVEEFL